MKCPFCENLDTKVIDSRPTEEGQAIRRRRECEVCGKRFTTYEKVEEIFFMVAKRDGRRESFDRNKVLNGIIRACEKRPISMDSMESVVFDIERKLTNMMEKEISSSYIGEIVMDSLKDLDEVAYVRFASVYRQFKDVNTFVAEIEKLLGSNNSVKAEDQPVSSKGLSKDGKS
jgi:transcriptional repressor NrdR